MRTRRYRIEREMVGYIDVREDELEDADPESEDAWREAAIELIWPEHFEIIDDHIVMEEEFDS